MAQRKNSPQMKLPRGVRWACPLGCEKGFLSVSQLNEHITAKHGESAGKLKQATATSDTTKSISQAQVKDLRVCCQENRISKSAAQKVKEISQIVTGNKSVEIYHLGLSVYKETARAALKNTKEAEAFMEVLNQRLGGSFTPERISDALRIFQEVCRVIGEDGFFFLNGRWVNMNDEAGPIQKKGKIQEQEEDTMTMSKESEASTANETVPPSDVFSIGHVYTSTLNSSITGDAPTDPGGTRPLSWNHQTSGLPTDNAIDPAITQGYPFDIGDPTQHDQGQISMEVDGSATYDNNPWPQPDSYPTRPDLDEFLGDYVFHKQPQMRG